MLFPNKKIKILTENNKALELRVKSLTEKNKLKDNEIDELKEKATYVTTPCDQDGIYNACVHFDWIKEKD